MTIFFKALYSDKTSFIFSLDEEGRKSYDQIDRSKLVCFEVYDDARLIHRLFLKPQQRLIVRTKARGQIATSILKKAIDENSSEPIPLKVTSRLILVGYQETVKGENVQAITIIFPDGHTEHISNWIDFPLYAVNLKPQELANPGVEV